MHPIFLQLASNNNRDGSLLSMVGKHVMKMDVCSE